MKKQFQFLLILSLSLTVGCGGGSGDGEGSEFTDAVQEEGLEAPIDANPIALATEQFGSEGNLWKPSGDDHAAGAGQLVVLLSGKYKTRFDTCEVRKRSGEIAQLTCIDDQPWTHNPYSCFANPDASGERQHWRANFECQDAAEVKVVCRDQNQEVTFTVAEEKRRSVCSRFG